MSKKNLTGRKVAITGGARGIGRATAEAFIAAGASVAIGDIDAALAEKTAAEVAETTGGVIAGFALDVTDAKSFATFLDAAATQLGGLDVLVNNAGIMPTGAFVDETAAVSDRQIDINVRGVIIGSKLAATRFISQGGGHIVNIASLAGIVPSPGVAVYCASKAAVVALGDALNQELPPHGVVVTTIAPSLTRTELISGVATNRLADMVTVNPEDVAATIVRKVASGRGGLAPVPAVAGNVFRTTTVLPEFVRNPFYKALGMHANLHNDQTARKAYLDRATE
jgi:NAD(P)-dependent dehydrogenase (short-subunit alcohol dehydrogenase family)